MSANPLTWGEAMRAIARVQGISDQAIVEFPWLERWV